MLSNTCKYAVRSVIYLAKNRSDYKIGIKKISEDLSIPAPFLGKILQRLSRRNILSSVKGPKGGFSVDREPNTIFIREIVEAIDGKSIFECCILNSESCQHRTETNRKCCMHNAYSNVRVEIESLFAGTSVADLLDEYDKSPNYFTL